MRRYLGIPQFGVSGMVIEDEHSLRAKERDRRHLSGLKQNPGYAKSLENTLVVLQ
jgi:hypothetical protein